VGEILKRESDLCVRSLRLDPGMTRQVALTRQADAERSWSKRIFGIGPDTDMSPASRLIHPLSPFGLSWLGATGLMLAYTAIITQVRVKVTTAPMHATESAYGRDDSLN
jgi:hypothetical protein